MFFAKFVFLEGIFCHDPIFFGQMDSLLNVRMSIFQKTQTLTFHIRWQGRDWRKERLLTHTPCSVIYLNDFEFSEGFSFNFSLDKRWHTLTRETAPSTMCVM